MLNKINVLDKSVAELIAAGEVVERPASIVKELLENSIDAGATDITVEITGGGVRMIRVSDNGCGISREDIPKAFMRHATSKVCEVKDLDSIFTLGFRGEALASIASMCKVELETKTADEDEGTAFTIEGGNCTGCVPAGCPTGCRITVRDVFFNTPARMKFLKKDASEGSSVAQVVDKCALSHPEIAFKFIRDGSVKLKTSGNGDLLAVIYSVYNREFADEMLAVDYVYEDFARVHGYISKPGCGKPTRAYQSFFINGRYVKTRTGGAALEEAYKSKITAGKFPACVLHLELDASGIDVNVHPTKLEVRFANEKPVFSSVYYAVKTALEKQINPLVNAVISDVKLNSITHLKQSSGPLPSYIGAAEYNGIYHEKGRDKNPVSSVTQVSYVSGYRADGLDVRPAVKRPSAIDISVDGDDSKFYTQSDKKTPASGVKIFDETATIGEEIDTNNLEVQKLCPGDVSVIGEAFGTYIILEDDGGLMLVDKHAAHERIIYERLKKEAGIGFRQALLTAQNVALTREEHAALMENSGEVEALGFSIEDFGGGTVAVREVPVELAENDVSFTLREIASKLISGKKNLTPEVIDRLYYNIACRAAVKAGDRNNEEELLGIVRQLSENPSITHCPHGRPVLVRLSRRDIDKMFGRPG